MEEVKNTSSSILAQVAENLGELTEKELNAKYREIQKKVFELPISWKPDIVYVHGRK